MTEDRNHAAAIQAIERLTHLRGWIVQSFAQVEFMLGHFIRCCANLPGYEEFAKRPPRPFDKRVQRVRDICSAEGPLIPYAHGLLQLADEIERFEEARNFMVHGWLEVFRRGDQQTFRLRRFDPAPPCREVFMHVDVVGLGELREKVTTCSEFSMSLFRVLYHDFGLVMPDMD